MTKFALGLLSLLMVYFFSTMGAAAKDIWEEDFRRCRVSKQFLRGGVSIYAEDKTLELDVYWDDGADLDNLGAADISVQIDNGRLLHPKPLGSFDEILPALSRGKRLQISIPDKPERFVDLDVGAGGKAVAFLRKCEMYWTNLSIATDAWERGRASTEVGEYAQAIKHFDQAIQKLPKEYTTKRAKILFERGQAKLRKGDKNWWQC